MVHLVTAPKLFRHFASCFLPLNTAAALLTGPQEGLPGGKHETKKVTAEAFVTLPIMTKGRQGAAPFFDA
jgi:hypothetical protein